VVEFPQMDAFWGKDINIPQLETIEDLFFKKNKKALVLSATTTGEHPKFFISNEVRMVLCDRLHEKHCNAYFLCLLLWRAGCRISETLKVTVADLDMMNNVVTFILLRERITCGLCRFKPNLPVR